MRDMLPRAATALTGLAAVLGLVMRVAAAGDELSEAAALLAAAGVLTTALVSFAGLTLRGSVWAAALMAVSIVAAGLLGAITPVGTPTIALWALALVALGALALVAPSLERASTGPPPQAVALTVGLLFLPYVLALSDPSGPSTAHWIAATVVVVAAWLYARAWWIGLWSVRIVAPLAVVGAAAFSPLIGSIVLLATAGVVAALAWTRPVRLAVVEIAPLRSPAYPIPPELAPDEVLEAARIDRTGKRIES